MWVVFAVLVVGGLVAAVFLPPLAFVLWALALGWLVFAVVAKVVWKDKRAPGERDFDPD